MCGRFAQVFEDKDVSRIEEILRASLRISDDAADLLLDSFNIAPSQDALVCEAGEGGDGMTRARFGLTPSWAKDASMSSKMINARSETAQEKPAYRGLVDRRRCVVPITGFYEWEAGSGKKTKQPWYVTRGDGDVMMLAGLWDRWDSGTGMIDSFSLLTLDASGFLAGFHHRMPMVLESAMVEGWMGMTVGLDRLGVDGDVLTGHRVGRRVNSPSNNDAGLVEEVAEGEIERDGTLWGG
jgi:putative SOS response-associated peptidase YedK